MAIFARLTILFIFLCTPIAQARVYESGDFLFEFDPDYKLEALSDSADEKRKPFLVFESSLNELQDAVKETRSLLECIEKNCRELDEIEKKLDELEIEIERAGEPELF